MLKSIFAVASLAVVVANVGCGAAPDSSESSSDQGLSQDGTGGTAEKTLTLAEAQAQVGAVRAKFDPKGTDALLFDASLAPAYLKAVAPIFAKTAPTDKINLGGGAFTYVSNAVINGAIFEDKLFDSAVASYQDLWSFSSYWGGVSSNPEFWTKLNGLIAHSTAGTLSDLQLLELATNAQPVDLFGALTAINWSRAKVATSAQAQSLIDAEGTYGKLNGAIFGNEDAQSHDIDVSDTFAVSVFKRSYSELRLLKSSDAGEIVVDLGGHMASVHDDAGKEATNGFALVKTLLTASEEKGLSGYMR